MFSLLVAIGIEAFNQFSPLRNEEKGNYKEESIVNTNSSRQEDEAVSSVSEFPPVQNVCVNIMNAMLL